MAHQPPPIAKASPFTYGVIGIYLSASRGNRKVYYQPPPRRHMDANELRELADRMDQLEELQLVVQEALSLAEEVDMKMNDLNLLAPGHATMELDEALCEIDEAMQEIRGITQR